MRIPTSMLSATCGVLLLACSATQSATRTSEAQPVPSGLVYALDEVDIGPELIECLEPNPLSTAGGNLAGSVVMRFVLGQDGRPEPASVAVIRGYNRGQYAGAARRRLEHCEWTPALRSGKPVRVWKRWTARFRKQP